MALSALRHNQPLILKFSSLPLFSLLLLLQTPSTSKTSLVTYRNRCFFPLATKPSPLDASSKQCLVKFTSITLFSYRPRINYQCLKVPSHYMKENSEANVERWTETANTRARNNSQIKMHETIFFSCVSCAVTALLSCLVNWLTNT